MLDASSIEQAFNSLQQRIDDLQLNLAQQNKLATLGMVTAVLAHEFNNILTPMISYTKFALSTKSDDAMREKALTKALSGSERLANIAASLLGFAKGDDSARADVHHAINETLACLARDLPKDGIALSLDVPESLGVAMNAGQFQQVLMNLIVNARSAMLRPGAAKSAPKRLTIRARAIKKAKIAEITIADTGPGIPEAVLPRIFEPFFSTKRVDSPPPTDTESRGGTGLGLTICQELITAAGGTIRAASETGKGAAFTIELPIG